MAAKAWLAERRALLVLDDIWENDVMAFVAGSSVSLLCTSRRHALPGISVAHLLEVKSFSRDEAETIFRIYLEDETVEKHRDALLEFAERVERLPIAIVVGADMLRHELDPVPEAARGLRLESLRNEVHDVAALLRRAITARPEQEQRLLNAMAVCALEGFWFPLTVEIAGLPKPSRARQKNEKSSPGIQHQIKTTKSGQESFQAWLQRHAQGFIDATSWEEFHGIADAHGVRLDLRANGFVFTNRRSLIHVKASSVDRRLAKTALEARLGTFVAADYEQGSEKQEYEKRPRFARVDTSRLWEEYQAQRELHKTLRQAKLVSLATSRALQIDGVKAAARAKRSVIKMTLKGAGRRIAYAAVQNELRQGIRAVNARIREERRALGRDTQQLSWVDWLQQQASSGRSDALEVNHCALGLGSPRGPRMFSMILIIRAPA